jgi:hypothetical protein
MIALMAFVQRMQGQTTPPSMAILMFAGMASLMSCGFILVFQFLPVLRQLRFLRTLPISATHLAIAMIAVTILPLIALGVLVAGAASLAVGTQASIIALESFTFVLAPASLCVFFAVWRGDGFQAYALLALTLFGFIHLQGWLQKYLHNPQIHLSLACAAAAVSVLLAFLLTQCAIKRSRRAYLIQPAPFAQFPWAVRG